MLDGEPVSEEAPLSVLGLEPVNDASNVEPLEEDDHPIGTPPAPMNSSVVHLGEHAYADICRVYENCTSCVADSRCGWCDSNQRCSSGGIDGPKDATCLASGWNFMACPGAPCDQYVSCTSCLSDPLCGWCVDGESDDEGRVQQFCTDGTNRGPSKENQCPTSYTHAPFPAGLSAAHASRKAYEHLNLFVDMCNTAGKLLVVQTPPKAERPPDAPVVLRVTPTSGPVFGHTVVTITGAFFGKEADGAAVTAFVGGKACLETKRESPSVIKCVTPPHNPAADEELESRAVTVRVGELESNPNATSLPYLEPGQEPGFGPRRFTYRRLLVRQVEPATAPTEGGVVLVVTGENFGSRDFKPEVFVGGRRCIQSQWRSDSEVRCVVAAGSGSQLDVRVDVLGMTAWNAENQLFSYDPPAIEAIRPATGPTHGYLEVEVHGRNFGPREVRPVVNVGGVPCVHTVRVSHRLLKCVLPPGTGTGHRVGVSVPASLPRPGHALQHRFTVEAGVTFSYLPPRITRVTPTHGPPKGKYLLRIHGTNLATGVPPAYSNVNATDEEGRLRAFDQVIEEGNYNDELKGFVRAHQWMADLPGRPGEPRADVAALAAAADAQGLMAAQKAASASMVPDDVDTALPGRYAAEPTPGEDISAVGGGADDDALDRGVESSRFCAFCRDTNCDNPDCATACPALCEDVLDAPRVPRGQAPGADGWHSDMDNVRRLEQEAGAAAGEAAAGEAAAGEAGVEDEDEGSAVEEGEVDQAAIDDAEREANIVNVLGDGEEGDEVEVEGSGLAASATTRRRLLSTPPEGDPIPANAPHHDELVASGLREGIPGQSEEEEARVESILDDIAAGATPKPPSGPAAEAAEEAAVESAENDPLAAQAGQAPALPLGMTGATGLTGATGATGAERDAEEDADLRAALEAAEARRRGLKLATASAPPEPLPPCHPDVADFTPFGMRCVRVRVGGRPCLAASIVSENELTCVVPPNVGTGYDVDVEVDGQRSLRHNRTRFDYDPPIIHRIFPTQGPTVGGVTVTVHGVNFGATDYAPVVTVGGAPCMRTDWITDDTVECTLPYGKGAAQEVGIQVGGQNSSQDIRFDYLAPVVEGLYPTHGNTKGGYWIKIYGRNFGALKHQPLSRIGEQDCWSTKWVSDSLVLCEVPHGRGVNHSVNVIVAEQTNPNNTLFSYDGPVVKRLEPADCPARGGCRMTVHGDNFGHMPHHSLAVWVDGRACTEVEWRSNEELACTVPAGTGGQLDVRVHMAGQQSAPNQLFSYSKPLVQSFTPDHAPPSGGSVLSITGKHFGLTDSDPTVYVGGTACKQSLWVSDTSVMCRLPERTGFNLSVEVEVDGQVSDPVARFDFSPPVVEAVLPSLAPAAGGYEVEIRGRNFPPDTWTRLGTRYMCAPLTRVSYELLRCRVPPGIGANHTVEIFTGGRRYLQMRFDDADWIVSVSAPVPRRATSPIAPGPDGDGDMHPQPPQAADVLPSDAELQAKFPPPPPPPPPPKPEGALAEALAKAAAPGNGTRNSTRDASSSGSDSDSDKGQTSSGVAFGDADRDRDRDQDQDQDQDQDVSLLEVLTLAHAEGRLHRRRAGSMESLARALAPYAIGDPDVAQFWELTDENARRTYLAFRAPQDALMHPSFSYERPVIEGLEPDHGVAKGGTEVMITGRNFGPLGEHPVAYIDVDRGTDDFGETVNVGRTPCQRTRWISDSKLECLTPAGVSQLRTTIVSVGGQNSSEAGAELWDYDAPVVDAVEPSHGPPRGGYALRILGANFGTVNATNFEVRIGKYACREVQWRSDNLIECVVPPGVGTNLTVKVGPIGEADGQFNPESDRALFSFDAPRVFRVSPGEARIHGGAVISIHGLNFGSEENEDAPRAFIGGVPCQATRRVNHKVVNCTVPAGLGKRLDVRVELGPSRSGPNELFSYTVMDCIASQWAEWTECTHACIGRGEWYGHGWTGVGMQQRHRVIVQPAENGGAACNVSFEVRKCNEFPCPVDCKLSDWTSWSKCSHDCKGRGALFGHAHSGPGESRRSRNIIRDMEYGGKPCAHLNESQPCNGHIDCPVDCKVGNWSEWSECQHPCQGSGPEKGHDWKGAPLRFRNREIIRQPQLGGVPCPRLEESQQCTWLPMCPIDCINKETFHWTACTSTCGSGHQDLVPDVEVFPQYGGKGCPGPAKSRACNTHPCVTNCIVTDFGPWSKCDINTCKRTRERTVKQAPRNGGIPCPELQQTTACGDQDCFFDSFMPPNKALWWDRCTGNYCPHYHKDGFKFQRAYASMRRMYKPTTEANVQIQFDVYLTHVDAKPFIDLTTWDKDPYDTYIHGSNAQHNRIRIGMTGNNFGVWGANTEKSQCRGEGWFTFKIRLEANSINVWNSRCGEVTLAYHNVLPRNWRIHIGTYDWYWVAFRNLNIHAY